MTAPHSVSPTVSTLPAAAAPSGVQRLEYAAPRIQPLGAWTSLTLVTSLPIGPGGMVFGGNTDA